MFQWSRHRSSYHSPPWNGINAVLHENPDWPTCPAIVGLDSNTFVRYPHRWFQSIQRTILDICLHCVWHEYRLIDWRVVLQMWLEIHRSLPQNQKSEEERLHCEETYLRAESYACRDLHVSNEYLPNFDLDRRTVEYESAWSNPLPDGHLKQIEVLQKSKEIDLTGLCSNGEIPLVFVLRFLLLSCRQSLLIIRTRSIEQRFLENDRRLFWSVGKAVGLIALIGNDLNTFHLPSIFLFSVMPQLHSWDIVEKFIRANIELI